VNDTVIEIAIVHGLPHLEVNGLKNNMFFWAKASYLYRFTEI